jgi:hypothetical protein
VTLHRGIRGFGSRFMCDLGETLEASISWRKPREIESKTKSTNELFKFRFPRTTEPPVHDGNEITAKKPSKQKR